MNLIELAQQFNTEEKAREFLEKTLWPDGAVCPHCGILGESYRLHAKEGSKKPVRPGVWKCGACRKQFTVKIGTIFEDSHIPLHKWLMAMHLMNASKKGMSSHQLHRMLGITYKAAWFMTHRIRWAMRPEGPSEPLSGTVEVDETYVGGRLRVGSYTVKPGERPKDHPAPTDNKAPVVSLVERNGKVRSVHVANVTAANLKEVMRENVKPTAHVMTDEAPLYKFVGKEYARHSTVNHRDKEYTFPPDLWEEGKYLMWQVAGYFDESDDNDRAYAVAGFVAHQLDCVNLHWQWEERILRRYNIEYFKASELNYGVGQFAKFRDDPDNLDAKFSPRERELFTEIKTESINVILEQDQMHGIGATLILPDYYRLVDEYKQIGKTIPAPYFLCYQLVMMESGFIVNALNHGAPETQRALVRPVFDSHEEYSGRAKQMFDTFVRKNPLCSEFILAPHYEDDKKYLVLQAADNLAYEARRLLIRQEFDTHILKRTAWERLRERVERIYKLNYEALKVIMDSQKPDTIPIDPAIDNRKAAVTSAWKVSG